ncbi:flagellar hook-length control protein FliK [Massilia oculi]|uniref:Flagellar hook-length control protein FliK n=1 Tax=Massilia hydrophila TaxID=3044279 RepID=A0ABS7Y4R9_9BURK|nr:flagellar hook-length control protein FliK [Massilia oculi]MCA1854680.1 flagellar hook-length control protein FliK [Massilia oculi]
MAGTDLGRLGAVLRITAVDPVEALGHPRQQAFQRALQTVVGQTLPARVLARAGDGSALVQVAGAHVRMALPAGIGQNANLALTVVAATPRPTFQLGTHADGSPRLLQAQAVASPAVPGQDETPGTPAAGKDGTAGAGGMPAGAGTTTPASTPAGASAAPQAQGAARTAAAPALPLPGPQPGAQPEPGGAPASLSTAARLIGSALAQAPAAAAQALRPAAPLLAGGELAAPRIAAALQGTVEKSGLFYESHLGDWNEGRRTLDSLRGEPQMQQRSSEEPGALKLVAQQLASHELQQVAWQGQLVPGLPLEWRIAHQPPSGRDDGADGQGDAADGAGAWHSTLKLQFPLLGQVEASLSLHGETLQLRLHAASPDTEASLRAHGAALETALGAAGLALSGLNIGSGGEAR